MPTVGHQAVLLISVYLVNDSNDSLCIKIIIFQNGTKWMATRGLSSINLWNFVSLEGLGTFFHLRNPSEVSEAEISPLIGQRGSYRLQCA